MARPKHSSANIERLLDALVVRPAEWHYGYELSRRLAIPAGSLYPALIRLSDDGLLDAKWVVPEQGGRPRHLYRITEAGAAFVAARSTRSSGQRTGARVATQPAWRT